MTKLSGFAIAGIVVGVVVGVLFLGYLFARWYTWRRLKKVNPNLPRVEVNPQEYQGKWYEIARYPFSFEKGCSEVTATYTYHPEKKAMRVENTCCVDESRYKTSRGWAYPAEPKGVFGVSFFPGIYGNYTVVYRDPETSIVSNPDKRYLWILSRTPKVSMKKREKLLGWLKDHDFDLRPLRFTKQSNFKPS